MSALDKIRKALADTIDQAESMTTRDDFDPEDPGYLALRSEADRLERSYREMATWQERKAASNEVGAALQSAASRQAASQVQTRAEHPASMGEQFIRSDVFTNYPGRGTTSRLEVLTRALPASLSDFADVLPQAPVRDITPPSGATPLLEVVPTIPVSQNSVDTVVWELVAGGPGKVPEGTAKPSAEYGVTTATITLDTIAAWTTFTRQLLEDAPAVRARIDGMLARDIRQKQESEAAAALVAATLPGVTVPNGSTLLAAIRKGMAAVQTAGYFPNAVLLNPDDYADLDIDVFTATLNGPRVNGSYWGLTPIPHAAQAVGTATVGDFTSGAERYVRTGINMYMTDSDGDTFKSNVFTLLAEARGKTAIIRPDAFAECSVSPAA